MHFDTQANRNFHAEFAASLDAAAERYAGTRGYTDSYKDLDSGPKHRADTFLDRWRNSPYSRELYWEGFKPQHRAED